MTDTSSTREQLCNLLSYFCCGLKLSACLWSVMYIQLNCTRTNDSSHVLHSNSKTVSARVNKCFVLQVKHDDLKEAAGRFVEELVAGKEFIADHKPTQVEVLDQGIKAVNEELLSLLGSLHEGLYVDATSPPADVVNALEQLQERLAQLKVLTASVAVCQLQQAHAQQLGKTAKDLYT